MGINRYGDGFVSKGDQSSVSGGQKAKKASKTAGPLKGAHSGKISKQAVGGVNVQPSPPPIAKMLVATIPVGPVVGEMKTAVNGMSTAEQQSVVGEYTDATKAMNIIEMRKQVKGMVDSLPIEGVRAMVDAGAEYLELPELIDGISDAAHGDPAGFNSQVLRPQKKAQSKS